MAVFEHRSLEKRSSPTRSQSLITLIGSILFANLLSLLRACFFVAEVVVVVYIYRWLDCNDGIRDPE